jgi:hypothetical protein
VSLQLMPSQIFAPDRKRLERSAFFELTFAKGIADLHNAIGVSFPLHLGLKALVDGLR